MPSPRLGAPPAVCCARSFRLWASRTVISAPGFSWEAGILPQNVTDKRAKARRNRQRNLESPTTGKTGNTEGSGGRVAQLPKPGEVVAGDGIEPPTQRFSVSCSTN